MISIREEQAEDIPFIREANKQAFGQLQEADLVDKLRQNCHDRLSLVAVAEHQVIGHILFSPATIHSEGGPIQGMGLGPMAVLPDYQRQGVGAELVRAGLKRLENKGCPFVVVLGHAEYYPRFGFEPASRLGIRSEWEVPDEAFMIRVLKKSEMQGLSGLVRYRREFSEAV
jgi:putative acetyltransferase